MGSSNTKPLRISTTVESLNLTGKRYVVTGGSSGSGFETVAFLAQHGAEVITSGRNIERGERLLKERLNKDIRSSVAMYFLDLTSMGSVEAFCSKVKERWDHVDGLVNNAGGAYLGSDPTRIVKYGDKSFDANIVGNHIGPFHLTNLLLPLLGKGGRIVNVSSFMHDNYDGSGSKSKQSNIDFQDIHFRSKPYSFGEAYGQSKLANVLHSKELVVRYSGRGIYSYSLHPGFMDSRFGRSFPSCVVACLKPILCCLKCTGSVMAPLSWKDGAQTTLHCLLAEEPLQHNGSYYSQLAMIGYSDGPIMGWPLRSPNPRSHSKELATKLWKFSEDLVEELKGLEGCEK